MWALHALRALAIVAFLLGSRGLGRDFGYPQADRAANIPLAGARNSVTSKIPPHVRNYFLDFAGDHSLDQAVVTEQVAAGYANYTVNLRLASGAEQSVTLAGPPGGLQIEMHDMTGDHVPNDVVLRPTLLRWPPTVLVNDGHDHFAVVVSDADPGNIATRENLDPRRRDGPALAFLRSSGFKAIPVPHTKGIFVPQLQQTLLSPFAQSFAWGAEHASASGRAPPRSLD